MKVPYKAPANGITAPGSGRIERDSGNIQQTRECHRRLVACRAD
jgi:hypothetical protein